MAAEEENFQRAALRLNIAQSAISRRMRELEHELGGVKLFIPCGRGVQLTESGRSLLRDARHLLAEVEEARLHAVAIDRGIEPRLRVGFSGGVFGTGFFEAMMLSALDALSPIIYEPELATPNVILDQLRAERLDVGVLYADRIDDAFDSFDFATEAYLLALSTANPLAQAAKIRFDDIREKKLIWYARSIEPAMHAAMLEAYRRKGARPSVLDSPSAETTLRWVARDAGLSFLPISAMELHADGVTLRTMEDFELVVTFRLVWLCSRRSAVRDRFIEAVKMQIAARVDRDITYTNGRVP